VQTFQLIVLAVAALQLRRGTGSILAGDFGNAALLPWPIDARADVSCERASIGVHPSKMSP